MKNRIETQLYKNKILKNRKKTFTNINKMTKLFTFYDFCVDQQVHDPQEQLDIYYLTNGAD
jgi:hypothetical protein